MPMDVAVDNFGVVIGQVVVQDPSPLVTMPVVVNRRSKRPSGRDLASGPLRIAVHEMKSLASGSSVISSGDGSSEKRNGRELLLASSPQSS